MTNQQVEFLPPMVPQFHHENLMGRPHRQWRAGQKGRCGTPVWHCLWQKKKKDRARAPTGKRKTSKCGNEVDWGGWEKEEWKTKEDVEWRRIKPRCESGMKQAGPPRTRANAGNLMPCISIGMRGRKFKCVELSLRAPPVCEIPLCNNRRGGGC